MKNARKLLAVIFIIGLMSTVVASADYTYGFSFPGSANGGTIGNMRSTTGNAASGVTPYVYPDWTTIKTNYFIATQPVSSNAATNVVQITTRVKKYFTWNSGAGTVGTTYYLSGYPDISNYPWVQYDIEGHWMD